MLIQAIESVLAQKAVQTEIIVVDDNSTEDNSFCIPLVSKYIKNKKNMGLGSNHKIGFDESSGEYHRTGKGGGPGAIRRIHL